MTKETDKRRKEEIRERVMEGNQAEMEGKMFIGAIARVGKQQTLRGRENIEIMPRAKHMEAMLFTVQAVK